MPLNPDNLTDGSQSIKEAINDGMILSTLNTMFCIHNKMSLLQSMGYGIEKRYYDDLLKIIFKMLNDNSIDLEPEFISQLVYIVYSEIIGNGTPQSCLNALKNHFNVFYNTKFH